MIEIKNEQIASLPENMSERYKVLYRLQSELTKKSECGSVSVDIQFFDDDDRRIRSVSVEGKNSEGADIRYFKNYYRNGQLSEAGYTKDGKYQEPHLFFNEDGTPKTVSPKALKDKLQKGM